jgi:hypothetical protein
MKNEFDLQKNKKKMKLSAMPLIAAFVFNISVSRPKFLSQRFIFITSHLFRPAPSGSSVFIELDSDSVQRSRDPFQDSRTLDRAQPIEWQFVIRSRRLLTPGPSSSHARCAHLNALRINRVADLISVFSVRSKNRNVRVHLLADDSFSSSFNTLFQLDSGMC